MRVANNKHGFIAKCGISIISITHLMLIINGKLADSGQSTVVHSCWDYCTPRLPPPTKGVWVDENGNEGPGWGLEKRQVPLLD